MVTQCFVSVVLLFVKLLLGVRLGDIEKEQEYCILRVYPFMIFLREKKINLVVGETVLEFSASHSSPHKGKCSV